MILVIGGAYQGKTEYAKEKFGLSDTEIFDGRAVLPGRDASEASATASLPPLSELLSDYRGLVHFEVIIEAILADWRNPMAELQRAIGVAPERIIIADEIGRGVIPPEREQRKLRDMIGRTLRDAARLADEVYRVTCGIGERIK